MLKSIGSKLEYGLALAGGLASLLATLAVWAPIAANQPLWPLPGVYLIEIPAIGLTGMLALWARRLTWVTWAAAGALLSFVVLGAFSIGPAYAPGMLLLLAAAGVATYRRGQRWVLGLGIFVLAAIVQAWVVLTLIS